MVEVVVQCSDAWDNSIDWQGIASLAATEAVLHSDFVNLLWSEGAEVSVRFSDNEEVRALNAQWREKDQPTNVLSFPMLADNELQALRHPREGGGPTPADSGPKTQELDSRLRGNDEEMELLIGDLIIAHGVCLAEAEEKNIPLADHVTHLIVHGTLHLLGYDHMNDTEAEHMEALEVKALASLGLGNPYSDD